KAFQYPLSALIILDDQNGLHNRRPLGNRSVTLNHCDSQILLSTTLHQPPSRSGAVLPQSNQIRPQLLSQKSKRFVTSLETGPLPSLFSIYLQIFDNSALTSRTRFGTERTSAIVESLP